MKQFIDGLLWIICVALLTVIGVTVGFLLAVKIFFTYMGFFI